MRLSLGDCDDRLMREEMSGVNLEFTREFHGAIRGSGQDSTYKWAILPSNVIVESATNYLSDQPGSTVQDRIACQHSIPKIVIAIVQTISAIIALYRTRGDQQSRYRFAAFGFTVLPYAVMSIVNLIGSMLTPDYDKLYMVSSDALMEAQKAFETEFDGVVGKLRQQGLSVTVGATETRLRFGGRSIVVPASSHTSVDALTNVRKPTYDTEVTPTTTATGEPEHVVTVPRCYFVTRNNHRQRWSSKSARAWLIPTTLLLSAIPIAVIGIMTGFQPGDSTRVQQFFTMFWMGCGIVIGALMPFVQADVAGIGNVLSLAASGDAGAEAFKNLVRRVVTFLSLMMFSAAAIGGFVIVGLMLKDYGSCTRFFD